MDVFRVYKIILSSVIFSLLLVFSITVKAIEISINTESDINDKFILTEVSNGLTNNNEVYSSILIDKITNDANVIMGKSVSNSIVKFLINDLDYVSSTDNEGNFVLLLEEGLLVDVDQINVKVCDYLDNELYNTSFIVHDVLPPIDPKLNNVINNLDSVIRGYGEPNSIVKVFAGDKEFTGNIHKNGSFEISVGDSLRDVGNLRIISYDYSNNYSNMIEKEVIDVIPPYRPTINFVDCNNNFVHGNGEANCEVIVSFDEKNYRSYIDGSGNFYVHDDEGLIENTEFIKVKVIDLSGNVSEEVLFKIQKENIGRIVLKSLDLDSKVIKDAMIKINGILDDSLSNNDKVFNLDSHGNLFLDELPFGDYELIIRYRNEDYKLQENILQISLNEENSEVEVLID